MAGLKTAVLDKALHTLLLACCDWDLNISDATNRARTISVKVTIATSMKTSTRPTTAADVDAAARVAWGSSSGTQHEVRPRDASRFVIETACLSNYLSHVKPACSKTLPRIQHNAHTTHTGASVREAALAPPWLLRGGTTRLMQLHRPL